VNNLPANYLVIARGAFSFRVRLNASMKIRSLALGLLITAAICLLQPHSRVRAADTNAEPASAAVPVPSTVPAINNTELEELRSKLDTIQRANVLAGA
jgi:hypothetical protein